MNTSLGYAKRTLTDTSVLLSGGGDKPLSNFIGSISWDSTNKKITYTPVGGNATDLVSFGSNAFNSTAYLTSVHAGDLGVTPTSYKTTYVSAGIAPYISDIGTNIFAGATTSEITVERSTNNGSSWTDVTAAEAANVKNVFSGAVTGTLVVSGNSKGAVGDRLRITFNPSGSSRYCQLAFIYIYFSTNGCGCVCDVEKNLYTNKTQWSAYTSGAPISGWSGPNVIGMGSTIFGQGDSRNSGYGLRLTFRITSVNSTYDSRGYIYSIQGFTSNRAWGVPSGNSIARSNTPYSYLNADRAVLFDNTVTSSGFIKTNSDDTYVLTGGGGHALISGLSVSYASTAGSAPASDVYAWAKASSKPTYNLDEITDGTTRKLSNYLPLTGGTLQNTDFYPLTLIGGAGGAGLQFKQTGSNPKLGIALFKPDDWGMAILNFSASKGIGIKDDGTPYYGWTTKYTLLHTGNSSVSKSGETLTVNLGGTSYSLTNTWRGIQDNLTSSSNTTESLSAKQGYLLANGSARDDTKLPLSGGTMTLGEGLKFHSDDNYFGTNSDARIISLLDDNDSICDGGLIIDERGTINGNTTVTELLRIRHNEFKWKGDTIWHAGNLTKVSQLTNDSGFITSSGSCASATNIAGGAQGSIPYQTAAGTTAFLAGGTNGYVLAYSTTSKAPYWKADNNTQYYLTLNGSVKGTASTNDLGTIYAPTSAGTGFLKGTAGANGTITWSWDNSTYNNYSLPTATASALGGVKVGTTLTSDTGYTKVHIKDSFIYYKDTWQAANTSQVGYVPSTSANTMLYANSSGSTTWGTPDLYEVNIGGNVDSVETLTEKIAYGGVLGFYFGGGMSGWIDEDGVNISHASSALGITTIGSSTASSGSTVDIPYIQTDEYGHITAGGTHTHTISVSGYLPTEGGELTGSLTLPKNSQAIKFNTRTGSGIKYDYGGNEALMISTRAYSAASILLYAGESAKTRSLDNNSGQWSAGSSASNYMGVPSMQLKNGSVLINTAVQTGTLSGEYTNALYVTGNAYLKGSSGSDNGMLTHNGTRYALFGTGASGATGIWVQGIGNDGWIVGVNPSGTPFFNGNANSATSATSATSASYASYLTSDSTKTCASASHSFTYYNTNTATTSSSTNGVANPEASKWFHHIAMVRGDASGYFFDLAFSLSEWSTPRIYFRNRAASNYSTWKEIITSANYTEYFTGGGGSIDLTHKTFSSLGSSTYYRLAYVYQSGTSNTTLSTLYYTSGLYVNNSGVYHTSDIAYKEAIRKYLLKKNVLDLENPVKKFKWKGTDDEAVGFIAQETEEWCPEAVGQDENGYKTVNYTTALSGLCSALYDEVKTLRKEIEELKDKK